ncbi:esterase family protein [Antrihabitans sp. YC2-6]|nr:alpha/beta hydrolase family protein [Antrihabitans sp. YC2-6]MBJ8343355.1 esterase family protein [Antrihabitans sp. YC2-6]
MRLVTALLTTAAMVFVALSGAPSSGADPTGDTSVRIGTLDHVEQIGPQRWDVFVYSPSMDEVVKLQVLRPPDTSVRQPTLYLLNGAGAGEDGANWIRQTDVEEFFADKNVNVVIPVGGYASYYTDWRRDDPVLGRNKWQTFLTEEVPPVVDSVLGTNGVNAIGGLSMSGSAVLDLAIQAPGLYRGVASLSGCAMTSDPVGQFFLRAVVEDRARGDTLNMWGPPDDPEWIEHDAYVNADRLRGLDLFISSSSGLPGPYEVPGVPRPPSSPPLPDQIVIGGLIEAATNYCTHRLQERLDRLGIPATFEFRPAGTHSWSYWQDALRGAWQVLGRSLSR